MLTKVPPCCNLDCQKPLSKVSYDQTENIQQGNEETNHGIQGMTIYLNISSVLYTVVTTELLHPYLLRFLSHFRKNTTKNSTKLVNPPNC